jgi:hypothetical protein
MSPRDDKIVFAVSQTDQGPLIAVGIPRGAFEAMLNENKTHHFDLEALGLPFKLLMFGGETHEACMAEFQEAAKQSGAAIMDRRNQDMGIKTE